MRANCRHYESRTYPSGEVVRKSQLDLAPEAPWRCPEECPSFARRLFDAGWQYGSLAPTPGVPAVEEPMGDDIVALLDAAEEIVNSAAPDILAEFEKKGSTSRFRRKGKANPKGKGKGKRSK